MRACLQEIATLRQDALDDKEEFETHLFDAARRSRDWREIWDQRKDAVLNGAAQYLNPGNLPRNLLGLIESKLKDLGETYEQLDQLASQEGATGWGWTYMVFGNLAADQIGLRQLVGAYDGADPFTLQKWNKWERLFNGLTGGIQLISTAMGISAGFSRTLSGCGNLHWQCFVVDTKIACPPSAAEGFAGVAQSAEGEEAAKEGGNAGWLTVSLGCVLVIVVLHKKAKDEDEEQSMETEQPHALRRQHAERLGDAFANWTLEDLPSQESRELQSLDDRTKVFEHLCVNQEQGQPEVSPEHSNLDSAQFIGSRATVRKGSFLMRGATLLLLLIAGLALQRALPVTKQPTSTAHASTASLSKAPAPQAPVHFRAIQDVPLGKRVLGKNHDRSQIELLPEPDPETWRKISLLMWKDSGAVLEIELLRALEWLAATGSAPGEMIHLDLEEMGAVGPALVTSIEPCPEIETGPGVVVTGRFIHTADANSKVLRVRLEGDEHGEGVTANHPYWSIDRQQFVPAGDLKPGELLDTTDGPRRLASVTATAYFGKLYNLETHGEHVYRVGSLGVLVHNTCAGQHHFWPRSWGNKIRYKHSVLNWLDEVEHTHIHKSLSDFLQARTGRRFNSQSGARWMNQLTFKQRRQLLEDFHKAYSQTPEGIALAHRLAPNTGKTVYDLFKEEYRFAIRNKLLKLK